MKRIDMPKLATRRPVDFSFRASLSWPDSEQYAATTLDEVAAQDAIRSARAQGLPDRISDGMAVAKLAVLMRGDQ